MSSSLTNKKIHLASDHAGFEHKEEIKTWLNGLGCQVVDHGAAHYDAEDDFPDFISLAAKAVSLDPEGSCAIIFGGSGQGEAMMANRFTNVRATVFYGGDKNIIKLSRGHNNANVLSIGARFVSVTDTKLVIEDWLKSDFLTDEKYRRRNQKIERISKENRNS